ncbi:MAG: monovalent cation/H+ antiporter subunit D family protein [Alphaproteobacteria bacterium]|nr:monovalent cation/H+ antiporter subunit D family protein [Alphaproteobacteria bacterium]MBF0250582.1 monovalent cation/H+ antiporter subunit D family protein [Alphaproteobacteria bacterium]
MIDVPASDPWLILLVVVPLLAAPLCVLLRGPAGAWSVATAVSWGVLGIAVKLLGDVLERGTLRYRIGGWDAPWGIEYLLDPVGAFVVVIVAAIGAVVLPYAKSSVEKEVRSDRIYLFYAMVLLCLSGLLGIAVTGDAFNLFVFLEVSSLSSYVLISLGRDRRALTAAFRYLIMGTLGATFYIIGVGLMYQMTGTLNIQDLTTIIPAVADTRTVLAALAFLTVGISLKLALFPLHLWLPNAYTFAPSAVTVFLSATATKVSAYVLLRIFFTVFGQVDLFAHFPLQPVLMAMALAAMFLASLTAIWQQNVKRMLAYSSVAQIGYTVLGISLATEAGLSGAIIHLFNHALMKGAAFMAIGAVVYATGAVTLDRLAGMGKRMPFTMAAFVVAGLGLIGMPLTAGFISKWQLITAALESGYWPLAVLILLSSLLAVIYVWRVVEAAYLRPVPANEAWAATDRVPVGMQVPMWVLAGASVYFGTDASFTLELAHTAARALMGGY